MVAQPALTKGIRKLEAYFGAPLFERLPRGSFTGCALIQRALENYLPLRTLVDLVRDEAAKVRRSA
jgi:DNA-binding transcriptional LysR family regulator